MNLFCSKKKWVLPEYAVEDVRSLRDELKISPVLAMLLLHRGIRTPSDARWFLNRDALYLYDPYLLYDMDKAVSRTRAALEKKERICVYGDYDVDGITATAILYKYLRSKSADVMYYIPERLSEGYGMNREAVDTLSKQNVQLIVTVDNGVSAAEEIRYARTLGIDVVVTDHHECPEELPDCAAVVDPHREPNGYPFAGLSGVGVAFKFICALEGEAADDAFYSQYIDLASLGTIADVMPLRDENRQIVRRGLACLEKHSNLGVTALIDEALCEKNRNTDHRITSSTVGFTVAPRLNAAGRIGDVKKAIELLITEDPHAAYDAAKQLCSLNRERQYIENKIFTEACERIERDYDLSQEKVLVIAGEKWHPGVIGIVSSRVTEKYGLPSILISIDGEIGKGSARSISGFNINEAIRSCRDLLIRHGGHELAAGLTLEVRNLDDFRKRINDYARDRISDEMVFGSVEAEAELSGDDISLALCDEIAELEPFGSENPVPTLYIRDVQVLNVLSIGQNKHTKLTLKKDDTIFTGLLFGFCPDDFCVPSTGMIDLLCYLEANEFRGERDPQAIICDVRMCKTDAASCEIQKLVYHDILSGKKPELVPSTGLFRAVYVYLRNHENVFSVPVNTYFTADDVSKRCGAHVSCPVLNLILDVFDDLDLIDLHRVDETIVSLKLNKNAPKVDLESSVILQKALGVSK